MKKQLLNRFISSAAVLGALLLLSWAADRLPAQDLQIQVDGANSIEGQGAVDVDAEPGVDPMKDVPEATRKIFDEALAVWIRAIADGREKLTIRRLQVTVDELKRDYELKDEQAAILGGAVKDAVAESRKPWEQAMAAWVKTVYGPRLRRDEKETLESIRQTAERMASLGADEIETMLEQAPVSVKGDPRNQTAWKKALARALTPEQLAKHNDRAGEEKRRQDQLVAEFRDRMVKSVETRLRKEIDGLLKLLRETIPLDEARSQAAGQAADAAVADALAPIAGTIAHMIESMPRSSQQQLLVNEMGELSFAESGQEEVPPAKQKAWTDGLAKILTREEFVIWSKAWETRLAAEEKRTREDLSRLIEGTSENYRQQFTQQMDSLVAGIRASVDLGEERSKRLEAAAKAAMDASIENWRKRALEEAMKMPSRQRERMLLQGYIAVGWDDGDRPENQKQWKDDLSALITPAEQKQWESDIVRRKENINRVATLVMISALDGRLAFTAGQRAALETLLAKKAEQHLVGSLQNAWSQLSFSSIAQGAREVGVNEVGKHLADWQKELWRVLVVEWNRQNQRPDEPAPVAAGPLDFAPAIPNPVALEAALSDYLFKTARMERELIAARMRAASHDIARAAKLSNATQRRLDIAAKGAVEDELSAWFQLYNDWVRNQINAQKASLLPANVAAHLRQFGRVVFGNRPRAEHSLIWINATGALLSAGERAAWDAEVAAREEYRKKATIALVLSNLDSAARLNERQHAALAALAAQAYEEYGPDIEQCFSARDADSPWELASHYNVHILRAIPEAKLKETLTAPQWKIWETQFRDRTQGHWDNIQRLHGERLKNLSQAGPELGGRKSEAGGRSSRGGGATRVLINAGKGAAPAPATVEGTLMWTNGQTLSGLLLDADADSLRWKSSLFASPADLAYSSLRSVTWPAAPSAAPEPFAIALCDGSRLFGELESIDAAHIVLRSQRHGLVRVDRSSAVSLIRVNGAGMIWSGPFGDLGWTYPDNTPENRKWTTGPSGELVSHSLRQQITLPCALGTPVEISFEISSSDRPEFDLRLLGGNSTDLLSTWDDELVVRRGDHFIPLLTLGKEQKALSLRVFWDPARGGGAVAGPEGNVLARWESGDPKQPGGAPGVARLPDVDPAQTAQGPRFLKSANAQRNGGLPPEGLTWLNRARNLSIESLRLRAWNGALPAPQGAGENTAADAPPAARFETSGGEILAGVLSGYESGRFIVSGGASDRVIFLDDLLICRFPAPVAPGERDNAEQSLNFCDGANLKGSICTLANGSLTLKVTFSAEPLPVKLDGLREIRWPGRPAAEPLSRLDKLQSGAATLHGLWEPGPGKALQWRLTGAAAPVPLEAGDARPVEISRAVPEDQTWPKSPALFFLADGQIAPGELDGIDPDGASVSIRGGGIVGVERFASGVIRAIQFSGPELKAEGFTDPGWSLVRSGEREPNARIPNPLELNPGDAIGHPGILAGEEIQFEFQGKGYSTLRLRLFADGLDRESPSTRLLLAHYGNQVYCGIEENEGNFNSHSQTLVPQNQPVRVRVTWADQRIQAYINGNAAFHGGNEGAKQARSGRGLLMEPANLWGNGPRPVILSNFRVRVSPGCIRTPPIAAKAREQALFLPRFRRNDPPRHLLVSHTGDLLRGSIEGVTSQAFDFRSGLEKIAVPRDRAAAVIWLKPPPVTKEKEEEKPDLPDAFSLPSHWLTLRGGARFGLEVESFGPREVVGASATLGQCRIPIEHIHSIRNTEPARDSAAAALTQYSMVAAPEPRLASAASGGSHLIGKAAPWIELPLLGGGTFDLAKQRGKVVILDFWATWCGPCVRALPEMIDAFSGLDSTRIKLVAVNQAESPETVKSFLAQRGWPAFAVALDATQSAGRAFGAEGIPHTVIIGPDGNIAHVSTGFRPGAAAAAAELAKKLLAGKKAD